MYIHVTVFRSASMCSFGLQHMLFRRVENAASIMAAFCVDRRCGVGLVKHGQSVYHTGTFGVMSDMMHTVVGSGLRLIGPPLSDQARVHASFRLDAHLSDVRFYPRNSTASARADESWSLSCSFS